MVVTDQQGRYLIPDLPKASYNVRVRGYGLVDSPKVKSEAGKILNLTAVTAPTPAAAADYYPGVYWYSMLQIPLQRRLAVSNPLVGGAFTLTTTSLATALENPWDSALTV